MTGIMESTVYLSVTALVILLFKWIFKNKLSAKWHVWIWALLALRLVMPSLPESSFSIFNIVDFSENTGQTYTDTAQTQAVSEINKKDLAYGNTDVPAKPIETLPHEPARELDKTDDLTANYNEVENAELPSKNETVTGVQTDEKTNKKNRIYIDTTVKYVHLIGAGVLVIYFVTVYLVCRIGTDKKAGNADSETYSILEESKKKVGVRGRVRVIMHGNSPMLMGLINPVIVLPDGYTPSEKKDIFIHELCHLKSGDIYLLWLAMAVLCYNWYNPVMWICFFAFRRDVEVYCDERVLKYVDSKKAYAALLVKTALKKNSFIAGTTSLQNGEKEVERRVKYMAYFKKPHYIWTVVIVLIAVLIGVLFLTNPVGDEQGESDIPETETLDDNEVEDENKNEENDVKAESENTQQEFSLTYDGFTFNQDTRTEEITSYFPTSERWEEPQNFVFVAGSIEHRRISLYYPSFHAPRIRIICIQNLETGDSFIEQIVVYDEEAVTVTGAEKVKSYKEEYGSGTVYELCVDSPESKEIDSYLNSIPDEPTPDPVSEPVQPPEQETPPVTENEEVFDASTLENAVSEETQLPETEPVPEETEITVPAEITEPTEVLSDLAENTPVKLPEAVGTSDNKTKLPQQDSENTVVELSSVPAVQTMNFPVKMPDSAVSIPLIPVTDIPDNALENEKNTVTQDKEIFVEAEENKQTESDKREDISKPEVTQENDSVDKTDINKNETHVNDNDTGIEQKPVIDDEIEIDSSAIYSESDIDGVYVDFFEF